MVASHLQFIARAWDLLIISHTVVKCNSLRNMLSAWLVKDISRCWCCYTDGAWLTFFTESRGLEWLLICCKRSFCDERTTTTKRVLRIVKRYHWPSPCKLSILSAYWAQQIPIVMLFEFPTRRYCYPVVVLNTYTYLLIGLLEGPMSLSDKSSIHVGELAGNGMMAQEDAWLFIYQDF
jgi:hypothetical protein